MNVHQRKSCPLMIQRPETCSTVCDDGSNIGRLITKRFTLYQSRPTPMHRTLSIFSFHLSHKQQAPSLSLSSTYVHAAIPHVMHANRWIMMRIRRHMFGHHGAHPMHQTLRRILSLSDADTANGHRSQRYR